MLYYVKVHESEGLDKSEGEDCVRDTKLNSGQCLSCLFYFYRKLNFNYEKNICNGCFHCMQYEKANYMMQFRVFIQKKELLELLVVIFLSKLKNYSKNQT